MSKKRYTRPTMAAIPCGEAAIICVSQNPFAGAKGRNGEFDYEDEEEEDSFWPEWKASRDAFGYVDYNNPEVLRAEFLK